MLKSANLVPRAVRSAQTSFASRAFAVSAIQAQASRTNTAGVDPRVLDGQVLLPKANMDRLCDWQSGLWQRLAKEVRNNPALLDVKQKWDKDGLDIVDLLDKTARDPALGLAFNYASLLLNNSFFLEGMALGELKGQLTLQTADESAMPESCGGEAQAKVLTDKLEAYAEGIVGGGWLWLVRVGNSSDNLDIVPTFASGTLLVSQRNQLGRDDNPLFLAPNTVTPASESPKSPTSEDASAGSAPLNQATRGETAKQTRSKQRLGGPESATDSTSKITPLAVLNLYELAWLGEKYGVWDKRNYAKDWFRKLDWSRLIKRGQ